MKRSHGGPVDKVERSPNKKAALVHFKDFKDAKNVVEKGDHTLDGNRLQVTLHKESDTRVAQQHFAEESPVSRSVRTATRKYNTRGISTCSPSTSTESKETGRRLDTRLAPTQTKQRATLGKEQGKPKDATQLLLAKSSQVPGCFSWSSHSGQYSEVWDRQPESGGGHLTSDLFPGGAKCQLGRNVQRFQAGNESTVIEDSVRGSHGQTWGDSGWGNVGKSPAPKSAGKQDHHDKTESPERETTLMIPAAIVQKITGDRTLLRNLTMTLKKVDGKFRWKQPNHIIIMCLACKPSDDWENLVAEQVQNFVQPLMQNEQPAATEEKDQAESSTTTTKTPTSSARSCAGKGAYSPAEQGESSTAKHSTSKTPVKMSVSPQSPSKMQVKLPVSPDIKQRITQDRSKLQSLRMALAGVHGKFCWQPKHITINCTVDHPSPDWERLVTEQVNKFIGPAT